MTTARSPNGRQALAGLLFLTAASAAGAAHAQDATPAMCQAGERAYKVGDVACIPACHGQQNLARCDLTGTGPAWTPLQQDCPNVMAPAAVPAWSARVAAIGTGSVVR